ncbi:hypothetical protein HMPREF1069_02246, partial [Bacteroides ovatus CL02T12C04]
TIEEIEAKLRDTDDSETNDLTR